MMSRMIPVSITIARIISTSIKMIKLIPIMMIKLTSIKTITIASISKAIIMITLTSQLVVVIPNDGCHLLWT